MGYLLLWVENLAVSLVFMAWIVACVGRWRRRWLRAAAWASVALVVLLIYAYLAVYAGILQFSGTPGFHWFYDALALAIAVLVGAVALRMIGLKRTPETASPTVAAQWPRGKLFAVWGVALALHVFTIGNLDQAAHRQLDVIRSDAIAQMRAAVSPSVPDGENAAVLYEVAAEAVFPAELSWDEKEKQRKWLDGVLDAFDAKDPALKRFMQEKGFVVRILHEAARRPACVFEPNYRQSLVIGRPINHLWFNARGLAMLLDIHSRWKLAQGDRRAALQDVDALFQFASHMSKAGLLGPGFALKEQASKSLQYLLSSIRPTVEELRVIRIDEFWSYRRIELRNWPVWDSQLRWCVQGWGSEDEWPRSFGIWLHSSPTLGKIANSPWYRIFLLQTDLAIVDRISSETEGQLSVPYWVALKRAAERPALREKILKQYGPPGVTVAPFVVQFFGNLPLDCANADARHAVAVVAMAVARFQAKHGRLPKDLDALVPEFLAMTPLDPFDGKPMKYKTTDSGVLVYSVGHGAVGESRTKKTKNDGMTFELRRWKP